MCSYHLPYAYCAQILANTTLVELIETIELGLTKQQFYEPNDPYYSVQEGHYSAANVPAAWEAFGGGSSTIVVQVIDSGMPLSHEDLLLNRYVGARKTYIHTRGWQESSERHDHTN